MPLGRRRWRASTPRNGSRACRSTLGSLPRRSSITALAARLCGESGDGRAPVVGLAIFARLDVSGLRALEYELTPDAIDLGLERRCRT